MNNNDQESEKNIGGNLEKKAEKREQTNVQTGPEIEANAIAGAEILESPQDGSFIHGLQAFVAWVKSIVANNK